LIGSKKDAAGRPDEGIPTNKMGKEREKKIRSFIFVIVERIFFSFFFGNEENSLHRGLVYTNKKKLAPTSMISFGDGRLLGGSYKSL
jgi:hypothetical protein